MIESESYINNHSYRYIYKFILIKVLSFCANYFSFICLFNRRCINRVNICYAYSCYLLYMLFFLRSLVLILDSYVLLFWYGLFKYFLLFNIFRRKFIFDCLLNCIFLSSYSKWPSFLTMQRSYMPSKSTRFIKFFLTKFALIYYFLVISFLYLWRFCQHRLQASFRLLN